MNYISALETLEKPYKQNQMTQTSSRQEVFCEKDVVRNFTKFTEKHLCQSLFLNNVTGLRPATLLKKTLGQVFFPVNFVKFLRTPFLAKHIWWLLLDLLAKLTLPTYPSKIFFVY